MPVRGISFSDWLRENFALEPASLSKPEYQAMMQAWLSREEEKSKPKNRKSRFHGNSFKKPDNWIHPE